MLTPNLVSSPFTSAVFPALDFSAKIALTSSKVTDFLFSLGFSGELEKADSILSTMSLIDVIMSLTVDSISLSLFVLFLSSSNSKINYSSCPSVLPPSLISLTSTDWTDCPGSNKNTCL